MEHSNTQALTAQVIVDEAVRQAAHVRTLKGLQAEGADVDTAEIDAAIEAANKQAVDAAKFLHLVEDPAEQAHRLLSPEERWAA